MAAVRTRILQQLAEETVTRCATFIDTSRRSKNLRAQKGRRNHYNAVVFQDYSVMNNSVHPDQLLGSYEL